MAENVAHIMRSAYIMADEAKLGQVIRNLVSNGLKFTPAGGSVTVSIEPGQRKRLLNISNMSQRIASTRVANRYDLLRVTVTDTGAGISTVWYCSYRLPTS